MTNTIEQVQKQVSLVRFGYNQWAEEGIDGIDIPEDEFEELQSEEYLFESEDEYPMTREERWELEFGQPYENEQEFLEYIDIPEDEFEELQSEEYHLDLFERWLFGEDMYHEWNPIDWCLSEQDMIDYEIDIHEHEVEEIVYNLVTFPRICFRFGYYRNYDD